MPGAGVDTVGLVVPVGVLPRPRDGDVPVGGPRSVVDGRYVGGYRRRLPGGGFAVFGGFAGVWAEASLPKRVSGHNTEPVPYSWAPRVAGAMVEELGELGLLDGRSGEPYLTRVDAVRDFDVPAAVQPLLLQSLRMRRPAGRSRVKLFGDPERSSAQTLTLWSGGRAGTLYDKGAESRGAVTDQLRFEARVRKDRLIGLGVSTVASLGSASVVADSVWEWLDFGAEVSVMDRVLAVIEAATPEEMGLGKRSKAGLLAYCVRISGGFGAGCGRTTEWKYRKALIRLGLWPLVRDDIPAEPAGMSFRLDWETGALAA